MAPIWTTEIIYTLCWNITTLLTCISNLVFLCYNLYYRHPVEKANLTYQPARRTQSYTNDSVQSKRFSDSVQPTSLKRSQSVDTGKEASSTNEHKLPQYSFPIPSPPSMFLTPTTSHEISTIQEESSRSIEMSSNINVPTVSAKPVNVKQTQTDGDQHPKKRQSIKKKKHKRSKSKRKQHEVTTISSLIKMISILALVLYTLSTIFSTITTVSRAYVSENIARHFYHLLALFWVAARCAMYALFINRLYTTFKESVFSYSDIVFMSLYGTFSVMIIAFICCLICAVFAWFTWLIIVGLIFVALDVILCMVLLYLFVKKLLTIIRVFIVRCLSPRSNTANQRRSKLRDDRELRQMLKTATKLTTVTFVSLVSNLILLSVIIASGYYATVTEISAYLTNGSFNFQVMVNSFCVNLYFSFGNPLYFKMCVVCDKMFQRFLRKYAIS